MWFVKFITFIEYHPYIFLTVILIIFAVVRFFWKEHCRPSYKEQIELEKLLKGFEQRGKDPEQKVEVKKKS